MPRPAKGAAACGSPKADGSGPCGNPAGYKTNHHGVGPCLKHGGRLPNVEKHYAEVMKQLLPDAYRAMADLIESGNDAVRLATAKEIFDRAGYQLTQKVSLTSEMLEARKAELEAEVAKQRALGTGADPGD